ncbi:MAG: SsrA-binding protein [Bacteroidetes bacterium]|jgi:SsrA-binding protein|nr:MAG: SsrA-binding protein [Bacteroidota bacterium]PTM20726.1 MAG: SsrA-binding protein [Bacteroidota bacterium]
MASSAAKSAQKTRSAKQTPVIENRRARFEYSVEDTYEAGLVLQGTEVKSIREGKASLAESFAVFMAGELWLRGMYIKAYEQGSYFNHEERRDRKLLLNRKEIREIDKYLTQKGYALVPLKLYFKRGRAKVLLGLAKGKKMADKRQDIKTKDTKREMDRQLKGTFTRKM